ncbi:hypothetical protein [Agriterribacter sp.]|uniref:hypothetical protein n=1 Tax=Agriterribacter sp. TaxID=2821509 RepID=UPI002BFF9DC5|nr:hypothetical protein [Agriterribacter sp.]HRO47131.1 hypothetical protein [Agriterribacter sp.]HRQ17919.1 hypothetical protein [Agriterribacter sp.]
MDTRITLNDKQSFVQLLKQLHADGDKISLLYDSNGLTRYEGLISSILTGSAQPCLLMQDGSEMLISSVIAVNGIFAPDYSEC